MAVTALLALLLSPFAAMAGEAVETTPPAAHKKTAHKAAKPKAKVANNQPSKKRSKAAAKPSCCRLRP
jgi:hypothetical protein